MFDFTNLPPRNKSNVQVFYATGSSNTNGYQSWYKPKGASMIAMITIAGGGGGAGGASGAPGTTGGGGGACSGITRFIIPADFLPSVLYVQVGDGGQGGAGNAAGGAGTNSYILTSKTAVLPNIVCYSGVNAPGGGAVVGTGGAVPTIAVTQPINAMGNWFSFVGLVGGAGGSAAAGTTITAWAAMTMSPGAGGGGNSAGTGQNGGSQTPTNLIDIGNQGYYPNSAGAIALGGVTGGAINGGGGMSRITPFFNSGGAGGAGVNTGGTGGNGGSGGYGCGGGGGGASTTGGRGGNGGDGLVIIISW